MLVAGIDVGNATTELVLARVGRGGVRPLDHMSTRTCGRKGSRDSLRGARRLLEQAERNAGGRSDLVAVCDLHPVDTLSVALPVADSDGGPIQVLSGVHAGTPAGSGWARGPHVPLELLGRYNPQSESVVVSVGSELDFEEAARLLNEAAANGWSIGGVVAAGDDAVLIHNRLRLTVPIVDEVDLDGLPSGAPVALEVAEEGRTVERLSDPAALLTSLSLPPAELPAAANSARQIVGRRCAAVTLSQRGIPIETSATTGYLEIKENGGSARRLPLDANLGRALAKVPPGAARALVRPSGANAYRRLEIDDACAPDLAAIDHIGWLRRGVAAFDRAPLAVLRATDAPSSEVLQEELGRPVITVGVEARAAATGALTTPGVPAQASVLDIGAGTIDLVTGARAISAAGGGELLTVAVSQVLGVSRALAERVKRGPAVHVATPHLAHQEDGSRRFLRSAAPGSAVGQLAVTDGTALTPFAAGLALEEWRGLRHALKEQVLGGNVKRCLIHSEAERGTLVVAGGGGLDHEVVSMLAEHLRPEGWVVARADVAGRFGSRFAVAWGAVLIAIEREELRVAA